MNSRRIISIFSLLLLALSVFGKTSPSHLRKAVSTDVEIDSFAIDALDDEEKRHLVSSGSNEAYAFAFDRFDLCELI